MHKDVQYISLGGKIMFTNRMRMTGFSGIDVADMVHQMMRAESFRVDRLRQQRDLNMWRQEAMRGVATSITQFRNRWTSTGVTGGRDIGNRANWNANTSTVTGTRGAGVATGATAVVGSNAAAGTHMVRVHSTASRDTFRTQAPVVGGASPSPHADTFNQRFGGASTDMIDFSRFINREMVLSDPNDPNSALTEGPNFGNFVANFSFAVNVNGTSRNIIVDRDTMEGMMSPADRHAVATRLNDMAQWQTELNAAQAALNTAIAGGLGPGDTEYDTQRAIVNGRTADIDGARAFNEGIFRGALTGANSAAFIGSINSQLAEFGTDSLSGLQRVSANLTGGVLSFHVSDGNTVSILNGANNNITTHEMGLTTNPAGGAVNAAFGTNHNLAEFLGLNMANPATGNMSFEINGATIGVNLYSGLPEADRGIFVNGVRVAAGPDVTVQDLMNAVNGSADSGVTMSFNNVSQEFTLQHRNIGADATINLGTGAGDNLFMSSFFNASAADARTGTAGNAYIYISNDGGETWSNRLSRETNHIWVAEGVTMTLSNAVQAGDEFTIEVARNTDNIREMVTDFVNAYNELVRSMMDLTELRRPRQDGSREFFMPLSEEQRRGMSDREIEVWEAQARTGILHRDETLRIIQREMTDLMFRNVTMPDGRTFNLGNMGIQLSRNPNDMGLLEIDEARFTAALENHADALEHIFTNFDAANPNAGGIAQRLETVFNRAVGPMGVSGTIGQRAGAATGVHATQNFFSRTIEADNRRIDNMMNWLQRREDQLFAQFSRMEQAMMQAHSQMMFFEQLMFQGM